MDVTVWLRDLGLERYAEAFRANDIDAGVLPKLTAEDLAAIGVSSVGHRRRLLDAIAALRDGPAPAGEPAATPPPERDDQAGSAAPEAERRQLTVLFADLVGSTALAARLDPEDVGEAIRAYHRCVAEATRRWGGHVAKYMGDGVLVYFGYPTAHEDDAERAVRAGLGAVEAVGRLSAGDGTRLAARVGIATGLVMVGDLVGEGASRERAVVGETPNLAARLQALAEPGGVVIAPTTRRLLGRLFDLVDLGAHDLKGFAAPVRAWRVAGEGRAESRFEALHGGSGLIPLVGRKRELDLLLERAERARAGEGQVVLLSGEPGIGKSRLLRSLRERLGDESYTPLSHYCSPYHRNTALHPVIGLLERAAGFERQDEPGQRLDKLEALLARSARDVREAAPLLAALLSLPTDGRYPPSDLTPQRQKQRTLEVLVDQLEGLAARRPVLALYEDAHWVDPSTLELLGLVIERAQRLPVLAVITFRPEFQPPWTGYPHVTTLSLSRLTRRHVAAVAERVAGGKPLPPEVVEQIVAKTDGVPLFIEELTKTVLESGLLRDEGDRYALAGPLPALAIPATLQDSLMARLDRLAPAKAVAQIGAAIGREFSHELIAAMAPTNGDALRRALDRLVRVGLVFRRGAPPHATYSFKHALVQDAAYQSLLKSRRRRLHAAIARTLEAQFPETRDSRPETLAHHYTQAGLTEQAVAYWLRAGERAGRSSANAEAVGHLTKGLQVLRVSPDTPERARLELPMLIALGGPLIATKGYAASEVEDAYIRAQELCERLGETAQLFTVLRGLCYFHHVGARLDTSRRLGEKLLELADQVREPALRIEAHHAAGCNMYHLGDFEAARYHFERSIALDAERRHPDHIQRYGSDVGVFCRAYLAHCRWHLGQPDQALGTMREARALADGLSHPFSLALTMAYAAMLHQFRRERRSARTEAEAALAVCSEQGFEYYAAWARIIRGWSQTGHEALAGGIAAVHDGLARLLATGAQLRRPHYLACLAEMYGQAGRVEEGLAVLAEAREVAAGSSETWRNAELLRLRGDLLSASARRAEAETSYREAVEVARSQNARSLELRAATGLARLWRDQGRGAEGHNLLAPVYGWFTEGFDTPDLKDARVLLDELA